MALDRVRIVITTDGTAEGTAVRSLETGQELPVKRVELVLDANHPEENRVRVDLFGVAARFLGEAEVG